MKKMKKRVGILLLLVMVLSCVPISAEKDLGVSSWAKIELLDAERYDLYSESWYEGGLRQTISKEEMELLIKNTDEKIKEVGKLNPNFREVETGDGISRGGYLKMIYNILAKYDFSKDASMDPIIYLKHLGVVKGNGKDLYLNRDISIEEAIVFSKRAVDSFYNKNNLAAKGLMWEAEKNGNKVYMLGSIHIADSSIYPFSDDIMDRFNKSDQLLVEVDISNNRDTEKLLEKKMEGMQKDMVYKDGKTLKDDLGEELYAKLKKVMDKFEIEESEYENFKPWAVIPQIKTFDMLDEMIGGLDAGLDNTKEEMSDEDLDKLIEELEKVEQPTDYGIDMYFLLKAKELNKTVVELESMEMQMDLLFDLLFTNPYRKLSLEEQKKLLDQELEVVLNPSEKEKLPELDKNLENQIEEFQRQLKEMLESWREGDAERLKKVLKDSSENSNNINNVLLGDRDKEMANKISKLLDGDEKKTYFVVVGAAHYVSDGMVIDNLKDMGYEVKSLNK